jgi:hypothetical protein
MLWDAANGMRSVQDVLLNDFGMDLSGWLLRQAKGISADGQTIVGIGVNPSGFTYETATARIRSMVLPGGLVDLHMRYCWKVGLLLQYH